MNDSEKIRKHSSRLRRYITGLVVLWTLIVGTSLLWSIHNMRHEALNFAQAEARGIYNKDLVYRRWAALHGGVYVPVTEETPPNPYLSQVEERDITTPSGRKLTLMNPAYMTRQVLELGEEQFGLRGHITSLTPLNPQNAPDPWEIEALEAFTGGETEVTSVEMIDGKAYLRLMQHMITEESCLKCHAHQGYKVGDIRGGISVSLPMEPYWVVAGAHTQTMALGHGVLWVLGLAGIGLGGTLIRGRVRDRMQAEEALRKNTQMLSVIYKSVGDVLYYIGVEPDDSFRFLSINPAFMDATGLREEEIIGKRIEEIIPEPSVWMVLDQYKKAIKEKSIVRWVETSVYPAGEKTGEVTVAPIFDTSGVCTHLVGSVHDITERKRAEEALQESEKRYSSIFNEARDGIVLIDLETGIIAACNPEFESQTGRSVDQLKEMRIWEIRPPEEVEAAKKKFSDIVEKGVGELSEAEFQKPNGDIIHIEFRSKRQKIGNTSYIQSITRDISERRKFEEQFMQSQKMEGIGSLAGGVAHDFNNLLTVITGHAELSLMALNPSDPMRDDLKEIQHAANRAADLTRQLLAFSRKQTLQPKILNLNSLITGLNKMLRRIIGEDIDLKTFPGRDLWNVKADPGQMEQVIINLAVNARDAMPKGGKLTIETQDVELDEKYAKSHADITPGPHVMLAISDTGSGMTNEVKAQIFDPFFTTKSMGEGTGLGLSTVYGIVKQSGGSIWVYSEVGVGTAFKIYLPKVEEVAEEFVREVGVAELPRGTETVLVVEDEDGVRHLACRVLKRQGYTVLEARTGGDAYLLCQKREKPVDLVITDVIMPNMGGVELVEKLREIWTDFKVLY